MTSDYRELRNRWRVSTVLEEQLKDAHQAGAVDGLSTGFFASLAGRRVYVKPRNRAEYPDPIAAREKICSDLAYELNVPVPPVVLLRRECPDNEEPLCCASLVMHKRQLSWSQVDPVKTPYPYPLVERMLADVNIAGARAIVFDTWVGQPDHGREVDNHNIVVGTNSLDEPGALVLLDYQLALGAGGAWRENAYQDIALAPLPKALLKRASGQEVARMLEQLDALTSITIGEIVHRIPTDFLSDDQKALVYRGLLERKELVKDAVTSTLEA